jgi:hypothetical protein
MHQGGLLGAFRVLRRAAARRRAMARWYGAPRVDVATPRLRRGWRAARAEPLASACARAYRLIVLHVERAAWERRARPRRAAERPVLPGLRLTSAPRTPYPAARAARGPCVGRSRAAALPNA